MKLFKKVSFYEFRDTLEKDTLEWIRVRKHRLPLFIILVILLLAISYAPYINLFLNSYLIIFLSVLISPLILDIDAKLFFVCVLILIIPTFLFSLGGLYREESEVIGNYMFILLSAGLIRLIFSSD